MEFSPEAVLDLREEEFDGIEEGRVGRQKPQNHVIVRAELLDLSLGLVDGAVVHDDGPLAPSVFVLDFLDDCFHVLVEGVSIDGCGVSLELEHPTGRNRDDSGDSADPRGKVDMIVEVLGEHDSGVFVSGLESDFIDENDVGVVGVVFHQFLEPQSISVSLLHGGRVVPTEGASRQFGHPPPLPRKKTVDSGGGRCDAELGPEEFREFARRDEKVVHLRLEQKLLTFIASEDGDHLFAFNRTSLLMLLENAEHGGP